MTVWWRSGVSQRFPWGCLMLLLKVKLSQNGFMKSSIFQKMTQTIWRISALCTIKTLRAEILQIFFGNFLENVDFINSFWLNLTFNCHSLFMNYLVIFPEISGKKQFNFRAGSSAYWTIGTKEGLTTANYYCKGEHILMIGTIKIPLCIFKIYSY